MATPEKKVKERVKKILDELGAYYFFPSSAYGGRSGVPDIIACYEGLFIGIECKVGKNKPTKLQLIELGKIKKAKGLALLFNDTTEPEDLKTLILQAAIEDTLDKLEEVSPKEKDKEYWTNWALQNIS